MQQGFGQDVYTVWNFLMSRVLSQLFKVIKKIVFDRGKPSRCSQAWVQWEGTSILGWGGSWSPQREFWRVTFSQIHPKPDLCFGNMNAKHNLLHLFTWWNICDCSVYNLSIKWSFTCNVFLPYNPSDGKKKM